MASSDSTNGQDAPGADYHEKNVDASLERERMLIADYEQLMEIAEDVLIKNSSACRRQIEILKLWHSNLPVIREKQFEHSKPFYKFGNWEKLGPNASAEDMEKKAGEKFAVLVYEFLTTSYSKSKIFPTLDYPRFVMRSSTITHIDEKTKEEKTFDEHILIHLTLNFANATISNIHRYLSALRATTTRTTYILPFPEGDTIYADYVLIKQLNDKWKSYVHEYCEWEGYAYRLEECNLSMLPVADVDDHIYRMITVFERILAPFETYLPFQVKAAGTKAAWRRRVAGEEEAVITDDLEDGASPFGAGPSGPAPPGGPYPYAVGGVTYHVHRGPPVAPPREWAEGGRPPEGEE